MKGYAISNLQGPSCCFSVITTLIQPTRRAACAVLTVSPVFELAQSVAVPKSMAYPLLYYRVY